MQCIESEMLGIGGKCFFFRPSFLLHLFRPTGTTTTTSPSSISICCAGIASSSQSSSICLNFRSEDQGPMNTEDGIPPPAVAAKSSHSWLSFSEITLCYGLDVDPRRCNYEPKDDSMVPPFPTVFSPQRSNLSLNSMQRNLLDPGRVSTCYVLISPSLSSSKRSSRLRSRLQILHVQSSPFKILQITEGCNALHSKCAAFP
jgi:hypothetical protein